VERKLSRNEKVKREYDCIVEEQFRAGVIKDASKNRSGSSLFCMPHKPVVKRSVVTAKVRLVFHTSDRAHPLANSINNCMFTGLLLQPRLWDIMVRARMSANLLLGHRMQKAFLQIGVKGEDRDSLSFLFNVKGVEKYPRFT